MTVSTTTSGVTRTGDGVTLEFSFSFEARLAAEIFVSEIVGLALVAVDPADYVVAIEPDGVGGTVTFTVAPDDGASLYIFRETSQTQLVSVSNQTRYNPEVVEGVWDKLAFIIQELTELANRSVKTIPGGDPDALIETLETSAASAAEDAAAAAASAAAAALFDPGNLAGLIALTLSANKLAYPTGASTWALTDFTAAARALLDDADAATMRTTLGLGSAALLAAPVRTELTTTSGTEHSVTGIPAGVNWVRGAFSGMSFADASAMQVRLGVGGSKVTSGYVARVLEDSAASPSNMLAGSATAGFLQTYRTAGAAAADVWRGRFFLERLKDDIWHFDGICQHTTSMRVQTQGEITLAGDLTGVYLDSFGGGAFDAGNAVITYGV